MTDEARARFHRRLRDDTLALREALADGSARAAERALSLTLPVWCRGSRGWQVAHVQQGCGDWGAQAFTRLAASLGGEVGDGLALTTLPGLPAAVDVDEPDPEEVAARHTLATAMTAAPGGPSAPFSQLFPLRVCLSLEPGRAADPYNAAVAASSLVVAAGGGLPERVGGGEVADVATAILAALRFGSGETRQLRAGIGAGYGRDDLYWQFVSNRQHHPVLAGTVAAAPEDAFAALRYHDATVWRWQRARVTIHGGVDVRYALETRLLAPGPTVTDTVALVAFWVGLVHGLMDQHPPARLVFDDAEANLRTAVRRGLAGWVSWFGRKRQLADVVIEAAEGPADEGLARLGVVAAERREWLGIVAERARTGRDLRTWFSGRPSDERVEALSEHAATGAPVHTWSPG
ncbi:hypothetical protein [Arhodomonas sp. AD133]|uniref:hypothetical protein n=1 Tax=Arhodomonas sp. AD133 TaxID=3415009 RepID=UPI003EBFA668